MARVRLNQEKIAAVVARLKNLGIPPDVEDAVPIQLPARETRMLNFVTVAINHQTTPVKGAALSGTVFGHERRGWDYLRERFLLAAEYAPSIVSPETLARFSDSLLSEVLGGRPIKKPRVRVRLLRDIGKKMLERGWDDIQSLYEEAGGWLIRDDGGGILTRLAKFNAYADPLAKKSNYFLGIMRNQGFWEYRDLENLGPPVNYHETRLLARIGILEILDIRLGRKLLHGLRVTEEEDLELRGAAKEAIIAMADGCGVTPVAMHYLDWNHARNCCTRMRPHCLACPPSCALPERYRTNGKPDRCVFAPICNSKDLEDDERVLDPYSETIWH